MVHGACVIRRCAQVPMRNFSSRDRLFPRTFRSRDLCSRELSFPLFRSGPYIPRTGPCMNHALAILCTRPYTVYMAVLYTKQGAVRLSKMLMKARKYNWTCASFGLLESTTQTADRPVQLFLHSSLQEVPILDNRRLYQNCPFPWGICPPPSNIWLLRPMPAQNPKGTSIVSAVFAQVTAECIYTLQWFPISLSKLPPFMGIWTPCNNGSLGPAESWTQTATRSLQPFMQGSLVWRTDWQTNRPRYSVGDNGLHVRI